MTATTRSRVSLVIAASMLFFALAAMACQRSRRQRSTAPDSDQAKDWPKYVNEFLEAYFAAHPDFAVRAGRHEFDGKLPDWSAEGIQKEIQRLRAEKERLRSFKDSALNERQRFERDYVGSVIDADIFWLESAEWPYRNPQFYADAIDPDVYVSRAYAPLDKRLRAYTNYARSIPTALEQIRKNLRTPLPKNLRQHWSHDVWWIGFFLRERRAQRLRFGKGRATAKRLSRRQ